MATVIINAQNKFLRCRSGGRFDWVSEYPDATEWRSAKEARGPAEANKGLVVADYGLESEFESYDFRDPPT